MVDWRERRGRSAFVLANEIQTLLSSRTAETKHTNQQRLNPMTSKHSKLPLLALSACLIALAGAGCTSMTEPASASFASVTIHGHTEDEIGNATIKVFREDGYEGGLAVGTQMSFQKEGSVMKSLAYEGVVATHEGART